MSDTIKILEAQNVENSNIDGAALNNFFASNLSGIVGGVLTECASHISVDTVYISQGLLILSGFRVKIPPNTRIQFTLSSSEIGFRYIIAHLEVKSAEDVSFAFEVRKSKENLKQDKVHNGYGDYEMLFASVYVSSDGLSLFREEAPTIHLSGDLEDVEKAVTALAEDIQLIKDEYIRKYVFSSGEHKYKRFPYVNYDGSIVWAILTEGTGGNSVVYRDTDGDISVRPHVVGDYAIGAKQVNREISAALTSQDNRGAGQCVIIDYNATNEFTVNDLVCGRYTLAGSKFNVYYKYLDNSGVESDWVSISEQDSITFAELNILKKFGSGVYPDHEDFYVLSAMSYVKSGGIFDSAAPEGENARKVTALRIVNLSYSEGATQIILSFSAQRPQKILPITFSGNV